MNIENANLSFIVDIDQLAQISLGDNLEIKRKSNDAGKFIITKNHDKSRLTGFHTFTKPEYIYQKLDELDLHIKSYLSQFKEFNNTQDDKITCESSGELLSTENVVESEARIVQKSSPKKIIKKSNLSIDKEVLVSLTEKLIQANVGLKNLSETFKEPEFKHCEDEVNQISQRIKKFESIIRQTSAVLNQPSKEIKNIVIDQKKPTNLEKKKKLKQLVNFDKNAKEKLNRIFNASHEEILDTIKESNPKTVFDGCQKSLGFQFRTIENQIFAETEQNIDDAEGKQKYKISLNLHLPTHQPVVRKVILLTNNRSRQLAKNEVEILSELKNDVEFVKIIAAQLRLNPQKTDPSKREKQEIIFDYCSVGNLNNFLTLISKPLEESESRFTMLNILEDILSGLAKLEAKGIRHCDIKPSNIFLWQNDQNETRAKIGDFGFAQKIDDPFPLHPKMTPLYAAPEYLKYAEATEKDEERALKNLNNPKGDVFAFGLILYEIMCGKNLFAAKDIDELKLMHIKLGEVQKSLENNVKDKQDNLEYIMLDALRVNPSKRASASELLERFKKVKEHLLQEQEGSFEKDDKEKKIDFHWKPNKNSLKFNFLEQNDEGTEFKFQVNHETLSLKPNDKLLFTEGRWKKLSTDLLKIYNEGYISAPLFIFDGISNKNGKAILKGRLIDSTKTTIKKINLANLENN